MRPAFPDAPAPPMLSASITPLPDLAAAADLLDRRFGLDTLYLFGSHAAGHARPDSDVDLACLVRRSPSAVEALEARMDLGALLGRDVDLVLLDSASPVLALQVLRNGRLLVDAAPRRREELEMRTVTDHADLKRAGAPVEAALARRFSDGRP